MTETPDNPPGPEDASPPPPPGPPPYPATPDPPPPPYGQQPWAPPGQAVQPSPAYAQQQWAAPAYAGPQKSGTNGFAIAALVFGIIGGCLLGIIFGIIALVQTSRTGQKGRGLAIAGIVLSGVWVLVLIIAAVVGGLDDAKRDSSGTVVDSGTVNTADLEVGDCLNDLKAGTDVLDIPAVSCAEPHEGEVYAVVEFSGSEFPGEDALSERAQRRCLRELRSVAPDVVRDPAYGVFWFQPTDFTWARGDRDLACVASTDTKRAGSITD